MKFYCHLCGFNTKRKFRLTDHLNNNHIITCELIEGLENQLFQVFNVISYALKNNVKKYNVLCNFFFRNYFNIYHIFASTIFTSNCHFKWRKVDGSLDCFLFKKHILI